MNSGTASSLSLSFSLSRRLPMEQCRQLRRRNGETAKKTLGRRWRWKEKENEKERERERERRASERTQTATLCIAINCLYWLESATQQSRAQQKAVLLVEVEVGSGIWKLRTKAEAEAEVRAWNNLTARLKLILFHC